MPGRKWGESYARLVAALRDGGNPDERAELQRLIDRLGHDLVRESPAPA